MKMIKLWLGWPFSMLYGAVMVIRSALYQYGIFKRVSFEIPLISVGNLIAGGSGKTPMVLFLAEKLSPQFKIGVLSRGYGRKTKGFLWVNLKDSADQTGDESMMIKQQFPGLNVAVCESRVKGVRQMLEEVPDIQMIILDDAFQHLHIQPRYNVLLTSYRNPYFRDFPFPAGMLREFRSGSRRADSVVVTKCPTFPEQEEEQIWSRKLKLTKYQTLFFAQYRHSQPKSVQGKFNQHKPTILITGIANATEILEYIKTQTRIHRHFSFGDHFDYTTGTFEMIQKLFPGEINVLTTEKDWVKWISLLDVIRTWNISCVQINVVFNREDEFISQLLNAAGIRNHG